MGLQNQPKILKGAFVEFGISLPPLFVVFQFNPLTITRTRSIKPVTPTTQRSSRSSQSAGLFDSLISSKGGSLIKFRNGTTLNVEPETVGFDLRLDATDRLEEGDGLTGEFGIAPELAALEQMAIPKSQNVLGGALAAGLTKAFGASASRFLCVESMQDPPIILWIWGRTKIVPVNIMSLQIKEEQFNTTLFPTRAVVTVQLQVIEGPNAPYVTYKTIQEVGAALNLRNIKDIAKTMVPG